MSAHAEDGQEAEDKRAKSLYIRRRELDDLLRYIPHHFEVIPAFEGSSLSDLQRELDRVMLEGGEGLVLKNPFSQYFPGQRPRDWVKIKPTKISKLKGKPFKCVIVGANRGEGKNAGHTCRHTCAQSPKTTTARSLSLESSSRATAAHSRSLSRTPGRCRHYLCAVAQDDDDDNRFFTCIKVRHARERRAERVGARSDFAPRPWTRWHTSCLMTRAYRSSRGRDSILRCTHEKKHKPRDIMLSGYPHWPLQRFPKYRSVRSRRRPSSLSKPRSGGARLSSSLFMSRETRATQKRP